MTPRHRDFLVAAQPGNDRADGLKRMLIVDGDMVDHTRSPAVSIGPAQLRRVDDLAGRGFDERRTGEKYRALALVARARAR